METNYFKFQGMDYFPVYGVIKSSIRFEREKGQNSDVKVSFDDTVTYLCAQAVGIIGLSMIPSALELVLK